MRHSYNRKFTIYSELQSIQYKPTENQNYRTLNNFKIDAVHYGQYPCPNENVASAKIPGPCRSEVSSFSMRLSSVRCGAFYS